jgi:hypothetical protein
MERLTIKETTQRLGCSEVTVRRKIKRGELQAEKEETAQGYEWRVLLPLTIEPPPSPTDLIDAPLLADEREAAAFRGTIAVLERELAGRNQEVERLTQLLSREQEIARGAQLALPARVGEDEPGAPQHPGVQRWWSRLIGRLSSA